MANPEHIRRLFAGPEVWNQWRSDNPAVVPDLSGADLSKDKRTCSGFDFSRTNFHGSWFHMWSFVDCNFSECDLTEIAAQGSYWRNSRFRGAHISGDLVTSTFHVADFTGATLEKCGLPDAELRYLHLNGTKFSPYFSDTHINSWSIINSDLSGIMNPDRGFHEYPSNVDISSLQKTAGALQGDSASAKGLLEFFKECGLPAEILTVFSGWAGLPQSQTKTDTEPAHENYFSCFISYSHSDREFARRLHDELTARGVQCWMDDHQILPGTDILDEIDRGIRKWDKVLLCCSENSLGSPWVDRELDKALQKEEQLWRERGQKTLVVIPLDLDGHLFKWDNGKASVLKTRYAADFTNWKESEPQFQDRLEQVFEALNADRREQRYEPPSKL